MSISLNNLFFNLSQLTPLHIKKAIIGVTVISTVSAVATYVTTYVFAAVNEVSKEKEEKLSAEIIKNSCLQKTKQAAIISLLASLALSLVTLSIYIPIPKETFFGYHIAYEALEALREQFPNGGDAVNAAQNRLDWINVAYTKYAKRLLTLDQFATFLPRFPL